jgi:hypothetical protein
LALRISHHNIEHNDTGVNMHRGGYLNSEVAALH